MKNKTTKKEPGRYCYLPALNFLSDNSESKSITSIKQENIFIKQAKNNVTGFNFFRSFR